MAAEGAKPISFKMASASFFTSGTMRTLTFADFAIIIPPYFQYNPRVFTMSTQLFLIRSSVQKKAHKKGTEPALDSFLNGLSDLLKLVSRFDST